MRTRILTLLLAAALPALPLARALLSASSGLLPHSSTVFRLVIGSVASLGAFDAVSGASTEIRSPSLATGQVGQAFSYRIIVGPRSASIFKAAPLPDGLYLERSYILGTPTTPGATQVQLTASDGSHSTRKWITIEILGPPGYPAFVAQPQTQDAAHGETVSFSAEAMGEGVSYQWYFNNAAIEGATGPVLQVANSDGVARGVYRVVAANSVGAITSSVARLFERVPLVLADSVWRFNDLGKNLGTKWRLAGYQDTAWMQGAVPLGYGMGDESTVISAGPKPGKPTVTTYFRHAFNVPDSNAYAGLKLSLQVDDGAAVYLNGRELRRENMPSKGAISFRKAAVAERTEPIERSWISTNIMAPFLVTGTNVLAVEVHQAKTNGADLRFSLEMSGLK